MIKAIIFDIGGVILNMEPILDKFIKIFNPKEKEKFWEYLNLEAIPLCRGDISEYEFWKKVAEKFNKNISEEELATLWTKDFEKLTIIDQAMMELLFKLKKNYKLAAISNSIEAHGKSHKKRGIFKPFDIVMLSHEVQMTKEAEDIFLETIKKLEVKLEECVFIDDVQKFVDTAESLGMAGILFKNSEQLKLSLINLEIKMG